MLCQIVTGIMAPKALRRLDIAATEHVFRQEDVDEALDVGRHVRTQMRRIDGHDQAGRNALIIELSSELERAASAHRVADEDDRSGILPVGLDRGGGDEFAEREFVDVSRDVDARRASLPADPCHARKSGPSRRETDRHARGVGPVTVRLPVVQRRGQEACRAKPCLAWLIDRWRFVRRLSRAGSAIASFALQTSPANIIAARNAAACLGQLCLLLTAHTFVVGDAKTPKRRRSRIHIDG